MFYRTLLAISVALVSFGAKEAKVSSKKDTIYSFETVSTKSLVDDVTSLYNSIDSNNFKLPNIESFTLAFDGFEKLKKSGKITKDILTIIDFNLPSTQKRLWVLDMNSNKILFNTLVAHGKNSGELFATRFSNKSDSYMSSLGFYSTAEIYTGKHGLSLKLDGLEKGINDKARERAIVIHGADYVSNSFINTHNKLGRSHGCPALPAELSQKIINLIKNKSCLYIYHT